MDYLSNDPNELGIVQLSISDDSDDRSKLMDGWRVDTLEYPKVYIYFRRCSLSRSAHIVELKNQLTKVTLRYHKHQGRQPKK